MNTREEINRAFADFQGAKNGFESARGWRSEIQYRIR
jgi:quercetin 2,3-dioxygenase